MTEKSPEVIASHVQNHPDLSQEIFSLYRERYEKKEKKITDETGARLKKYFSELITKLGPAKPPEKIPEKKYDELALSILAKEYLESHKSEIRKENPDTSCIILYLPTESRATKLCIPRSNPTNSPIKIPPFTLTPVPKSNGYNTEYNIIDQKGNTWTQLAILFPAENPKYKKRQLFLAEKQALFAEITHISAELARVPKKGKKPKKEVDQSPLRERISILKERAKTLENNIRSMGDISEYTHFSYIPYREGLGTKDIQKQGYSYLSEAMKKTYAYSLGTSTLGDMRSNASGLSIASALPWQYPFILNLIERMDFEVYFDASGKTLKTEREYAPIMEAQLAKSLTTFGANKTDAFNWQKSKVGAQGVGQIMPGTYGLYKADKKYGVLFPQSDFDEAARDHETSFRLQLTHFDDQIYQFPQTIRSNWSVLMHDKKTTVELVSLLAAGYNGTMKRIVDETLGDIIVNPPPDKESLMRTYRERLSPESIIRAMDIAKDRDIADIHEFYKPKPKRDKKTKKLVLPKEQPPTKEEILAVQKRTATYKESMTYVLKAQYVWGYLKKEYPSF